MLRTFFLVTSLLTGAACLSSCSKKTEGVCYCTYLSGDKKEFDLRYLDRQGQKDTCAQISQNASHFAGSCKLK